MTLYTSNGMEKDYEDSVQHPSRRRIQPQILAPKTCDHKKGTCPAPGLPELNPYGVEWCDRTKLWYDQMAHSPQSKLFAETDWIALEEACITYDCIWNRHRSMGRPPSANAMVQLLCELRRRVAVWGYNHYDRIQLRMKVNTPQSVEQEEAEVAREAESAINYLEMLNGMVADKQQVGDGT